MNILPEIRVTPGGPGTESLDYSDVLNDVQALRLRQGLNKQRLGGCAKGLP